MMNTGAIKPVMNERTAPIVRGFHAGGGSSSGSSSSSDKENRKSEKEAQLITMP